MQIINKFKILTYNIGFIYKDVGSCLSTQLEKGDIIWMKHTYNDRFFADPFLFRKDDKYYYILCEEYTFWEEKGFISLLTIEKTSHTLISKQPIIIENYHLSFPFCELNGDWVVPEASQSGKTYAYRIDFQERVIIEKREILDEGLVDNVYYTDDSGDVWLYTSKAIIPSTELYVYHLNSNGKFDSVQKGPIESNNRTTRGAGRFFSYNGKLYRPVQDCFGRYGRQTKLMEIKRIGTDGYHAEEVNTINSFKNPPYNETMHTFNVYDDVIVIDGSKDFVRFPKKIFFKKMRFLHKEE